MPPNATSDPAALSSARLRVPQHVVFRSFPTETVVLNLESGRYHGLNATAGRMLEALQRADSLHDAALAVAGDYEQPLEVVEGDLCELCGLLLERGLIEVDGGAAG
jgi:hypothetical protein